MSDGDQSSGPVVAIDGPGGAGKSTLARALARRLDLDWLDTGAMYRAVALLALRHGVHPDDVAALRDLAHTMSLTLGEEVLLDGEVVSAEIRSPEVDAVVSRIAAYPEVRAELVTRQRRWVAEHGAGVVEGRDIGSVVLPDADLKIYLTASSDVRARRRADERAPERTEVSAGELAATQAAIAARDDLDSTRAVSPLLAANDAVVLDSTGRDSEDVLEEALALLAARRDGGGSR